MFNDLNNPNNQGHSPVDDIFAETDKTQEGNQTSNAAANSGIETRRVGLSASDGTIEEGSEKLADNKWFKISLIAVIVAIIILGGYLVYSKFFKANTELAANLPAPVSNTPEVSSTPKSDGSFVAPVGNETKTATTSLTEQPTTIPEIPGVNAPVAVISTSSEVITPPVPLIDSDSDGLTDTEESAAGTNINVIDTDNDGLSDYEEVKIYHTNPLSADSDGDSYLDGAEVKGGYDPNGPGKLIKPASTPKTSGAK